MVWGKSLRIKVYVYTNILLFLCILLCYKQKKLLSDTDKKLIKSFNGD